METRANYALIGAFTLATIAAGFLFVLWFSGNQNPSGLKSYRIVFSSSVSGLSRGSSVLFNGLRVGEVTSVVLGDDPSQVYAVINVDRRTPVKKDTHAQLEYQGLTGVAAVALSGGSSASPELEAGPSGSPPEIMAERSQYQDILASVQNLSAKADTVLDDVHKLVADNSGKLNDTISQIDRVTATLDANRDNLNSIISNANALTANLNTSATKLNGVLDGAQDLLTQPAAKGMFTQVAEAARSIRLLADSLNKVAGPSLQKYQALASDGQKTLGEINNAIRSFERNPQQLIFGAKPSLPEYSGSGQK
ncbi:MAG TPA: MlaD family protein [Beijerinckiaceae bacterium]|nr:MlaD family protein [Beijerinckiaceae bacterium]